MKKLVAASLVMATMGFTTGADAYCLKSGYISRVSNFAMPAPTGGQSDTVIYMRISGNETSKNTWYATTSDPSVAAAANAAVTGGSTRVDMRGNAGTVGVNDGCPTTGALRYMGAVEVLWLNP